jgi:hypothetical protein
MTDFTTSSEDVELTSSPALQLTSSPILQLTSSPAPQLTSSPALPSSLNSPITPAIVHGRLPSVKRDEHSHHCTPRASISASSIEAPACHKYYRCEQKTPNSSRNSTSAGETNMKPRHSRPEIFALLAFIALCLSIFLVALDTVLIPTALPTIALSFHIPDSLYAWIGSAYLLANAASVPFWGTLSDVFGRKPVILVADTIFLGGSILCGVSVNATMLVAGRVVQGFGGGGVVVLVHICVSDMFSIR